VAQLDTMLRALADRGAAELCIKEGAQPTFEYPNGDKPVSNSVLSRSQIVSLITELRGTKDGKPIGDGPSRFVYDLADGKSFSVEADVVSGSLVARIVPQPDAAGTKLAPSSFSTAGSPVTAPSGHSKLKPFEPGNVRAGAPAIEAYLAYMVDAGGSDLHLCPGEVPMIRLHGEMVRFEAAKECTPDETQRLLYQLMPTRYREEFEAGSDSDFAYEIPGVARFRCNIYADRKGTGAVFRVIPAKFPTAEDLGLPKAVLDLCFLRKGLVLVTGPTGSGKTTTLYAAISEIKNDEDKIITIEDPVEYQLPGITQIPVNEKKGLTFARGLRSILRHDPDKIMVGEIRDAETAQIAIQSALTGHLVFTTVHANNVVDVLGRFLNMGVEPYNFVSALNCILAQRLVRLICASCKRPVKSTREQLQMSGLDPSRYLDYTFYEGKGCIDCNGTGYTGRTAIAELLDMSDRIREMILEKKPAADIKRAAKEEGMTFLREAALAKVFVGKTTLHEINKVTFIE